MKSMVSILNKEPSMKSYLELYGKGTITWRENRIYLHGRAYSKRAIILENLIRKWGKQYNFKPDFFAGQNIIEVY